MRHPHHSKVLCQALVGCLLLGLTGTLARADASWDARVNRYRILMLRASLHKHTEGWRQLVASSEPRALPIFAKDYAAKDPRSRGEATRACRLRICVELDEARGHPGDSCMARGQCRAAGCLALVPLLADAYRARWAWRRSGSGGECAFHSSATRGSQGSCRQPSSKHAGPPRSTPWGVLGPGFSVARDSEHGA